MALVLSPRSIGDGGGGGGRGDVGSLGIVGILEGNLAFRGTKNSSDSQLSEARLDGCRSVCYTVTPV